MINIVYDKKVSMMFVFSSYDFIAIDINCESSKGGSQLKQIIVRQDVVHSFTRGFSSSFFLSDNVIRYHGP